MYDFPNIYFFNGLQQQKQLLLQSLVQISGRVNEIVLMSVRERERERESVHACEN